MNKKNNWCGIVIVFLCVALLVLVFGFCILSMQLEQYKKNAMTFDINFVDVKLISSIKGGDIEPTGNISIDKSGNILNMNFSLYNEYDEMSYEVKVRNDGSTPATITNLLASPDFKSADVLKNISPIVVSISELSGKSLEPLEESTIKITVRYGTSNEKIEKREINGKIGIIAEAVK